MSVSDPKRTFNVFYKPNVMMTGALWRVRFFYELGVFERIEYQIQLGAHAFPLLLHLIMKRGQVAGKA
jgi:hypothetical protein